MKENDNIVIVKVDKEFRAEGMFFYVKKDDEDVDIFCVKEEAITRGKEVAKEAKGHLFVDGVFTEDFTYLKGDFVGPANINQNRNKRGCGTADQDCDSCQ